MAVVMTAGRLKCYRHSTLHTKVRVKRHSPHCLPGSGRVAEGCVLCWGGPDWRRAHGRLVVGGRVVHHVL